jgi:nucleoside-diphosphate-sugar epimerase
MVEVPTMATTSNTIAPVVVTGAAGFIGSHLTDALLTRGTDVIGADRRSFTDDVAARNLANAIETPGLRLRTLDLSVDRLDGLVADATTVFHLAAVPGVRESWAERFDDYVASNIVATQRLLAACERAGVARFVFASSSSVYGPASRPSREGDPTYPMSPYAATKLAAENLCLAHAARTDTTMSVAVLRYFTVYGPRQRASMGISRVLSAILTGEQVPLYGDGQQRREFTYVDDIVEATLTAATVSDDIDGEVVNIGGGQSVSMVKVIRLAGEIAGRRVAVRPEAAQAGDVEATAADLSRAQRLLGYRPGVDLREGMRRQLTWMAAQPCSPTPPESVTVEVA